jgi:hypothetical protein
MVRGARRPRKVRGVAAELFTGGRRSVSAGPLAGPGLTRPALPGPPGLTRLALPGLTSPA